MRIKTICYTLLVILISMSVKAQVNESNIEKTVLSEGQVLIKKSQDALNKNEFKKAVDLCKKAIESDSGNSEFYLILGDTYGAYAQHASIFKKMGLAKNCKAAYINSIALDGKNIKARTRLISYYLMAPWIAGGSSKKAKIQAEEIFRIDQYKGHFALATYYDYKKKTEKVLSEYLKAIKLKPKECDAYFKLGFYYNKLKDYKNCKINLLKVLELNPEKILAWYSLGTSCLDSGKNLDKGLKYFDKFLSYKSKKYKAYESYAHWRKGLIYEKLNLKKNAEQEYRVALKIKPDNKEAKKALNKLLN